MSCVAGVVPRAVRTVAFAKARCHACFMRIPTFAEDVSANKKNMNKNSNGCLYAGRAVVWTRLCAAEEGETVEGGEAKLDTRRS